MQMGKLFKRNCYAVFLIFLVVHASWGYVSNGNQSGTEDETESEQEQNLPVFTLNYSRIQMPLEITLWILLASFAKIGFNVYERITIWIPETCLLIGVGLIVGAIMHSVQERPPAVLTSRVFFLYILPPLVLDSGYFMPIRPFIENIGTVLWVAVVGTLWNSIGVGLSLYAVCCIDFFGVRDISVQENLLFASIISAVDPVAVLSIFEDLSVNEQLYIVALGECLFSDAVTVVLYDMFTFLAGMPKVESRDVFLGMTRFLVVGVGGLLLGVLFGFVAAFTTRFTSKVSEIEPLFAFMYSYLAYLVADMLSTSSIMAIVTCALTMKYYVEENVAQNSCTTIRHVIKMLATLSETVIFLFLGVVTVTTEHQWNWGYMLFTLLFAFVWRALGVVVLMHVINPFRTIGFNYKDQFSLTYGGLRGAISFALVFLLPQTIVWRRLFLTATVTIIIFTVFIQGISIRPLIQFINVRKTNWKLESINVEIHVRAMEHTVVGIEDICAQWSHHYWKDKLQKFNDRFIRWILIRDNQPESSIVSLYKKLELQNVMDILEPPAVGDSLSPETPNQEESASKLKKKFLASDLRNMHNLLSKNMYKIRQRTVSYTSKHALPDETRTREILMRRHASLHRSLRGVGEQHKNLATTQRYFSLPAQRRWEHTSASKRYPISGNFGAEVELDHSLASPRSRLLRRSTSLGARNLGACRDMAANAGIAAVKDHRGRHGARRTSRPGSSQSRPPYPCPARQHHLQDPVNNSNNRMEASDNGMWSPLL
ncbi:sodium/hydrogen exchanger 2-like isoform X1 [Paramormyrops kingsleyae]|uniref:Sodium/hydrogen exchanger n=2 Tax=Paramormyrops kingsleyae TaxID=1676925 RepID=A0A3B3SMF3_9TELE|nr:sodium/hydrogen exchanger 2-like [Paramormyrops kingsleyae]